MVFTMKQARAVKEMTQQEVAFLLKVHKTTYARWEKKPDIMPLGKAKEFVKIMGLNVDEIFFDRGSTLSRQGRRSSA